MVPTLAKRCALFPIKLIVSIVIISIALFWSVIVVFRMVTLGMKKGFRNVLRYNDRTRQAPPTHFVAWDNETRHKPGPSTKKWNHAYITVPETGLRFHYVHSGQVPTHLAISEIDGETAKLHEDGEDKNTDTKPKLILCVHGYPENWFSWRHLLRHYDTPSPGDGSYFVVAIDTRGYGDSDKPVGKMCYHVRSLVCDIKGIVNALGYEKCVYVGHDWGGAIGWAVAETYPEVLEKCIILNCPNEKAALRVIKSSPSQLLNSWYMFFYQMPFLPEITTRMGDYKFIALGMNGSNGGIRNQKNKLTDEELEVFKYSLRQSSSAPINYYRALLWPFCQPGPRLLYPQLERKQKSGRAVPTLLIWGDKDAFLIKKMAECVLEDMDPKSGSKVVFVEGASHWLQQDEPEKTIEIINEFLR